MAAEAAAVGVETRPGRAQHLGSSSGLRRSASLSAPCRSAGRGRAGIGLGPPLPAGGTESAARRGTARHGPAQPSRAEGALRALRASDPAAAAARSSRAEAREGFGVRSPARSASGSPAPALLGQGRAPGMLLGGMLPAAPGTSPVRANRLGASLAKCPPNPLTKLLLLRCLEFPCVTDIQDETMKKILSEGLYGYPDPKHNLFTAVHLFLPPNPTIYHQNITLKILQCFPIWLLWGSSLFHTYIYLHRTGTSR